MLGNGAGFYSICSSIFAFPLSLSVSSASFSSPLMAGLSGSFRCTFDDDQEVAGLIPPGRQHSFVENDHEIFSTVILSH